ncbi:unnamed protein product [Didymodactylos carnosus]|uniref:Uncharacterized protein n=1 Tax=Didymodactylos carnosus TaxID=1234261 RepID=A0A814Q8Z1_9BILA|nr:unnamed protein product [Didymodactylos carnosus]CAF3880416.1 unnamed protein product [Didymodactylos carnosus]CAF4389243.1 unnamed protein product [Didymodactylos carnosus]
MVGQPQTSLLVTVKRTNEQRSVVEICYPKKYTNQYYNNERYLNDFPNITADNQKIQKIRTFQPKSTYYNSNRARQYNKNNSHMHRLNYYQNNSWKNNDNRSMYTNNFNESSLLKPVPLMDIKENIMPSDYYVPYYWHKSDNFRQSNKTKSKYNNREQQQNEQQKTNKTKSKYNNREQQQNEQQKTNKTTSLSAKYTRADLDWDYYDFEHDLPVLI